MLLITPQAHTELEPQAGVSPASSALQVRRIVGSATAAMNWRPRPDSHRKLDLRTVG